MSAMALLHPVVYDNRMAAQQWVVFPGVVDFLTLLELTSGL
jgi:hypothetical protein